MTGTSLSLRQQCMEIKWPQIRSSDSTDHYFSLFIAPITPDRPAHHNFQGFCKIDTSLNFGACASGLRGILASSQLAAQTKIGAFQRIQPFSSFFRSGVLEFCLPTIHISSCEKMVSGGWRYALSNCVVLHYMYIAGPFRNMQNLREHLP